MQEIRGVGIVPILCMARVICRFFFFAVLSGRGLISAIFLYKFVGPLFTLSGLALEC